MAQVSAADIDLYQLQTAPLESKAVSVVFGVASNAWPVSRTS
jgi:hypothetical protein